MPSPFPGMDPYLESPAFWSDFHARFLTYLSDTIADRLPPSYEARIDERVSLAGPPGRGRKRVEPDVSIIREPAEGVPARAVGGTAVATIASEPVAVPLRIGRRRQRFVKILKRPDRTLVTVIELLSPSNKAGDDRGAYLANRQAILQQEVHLLELDLLLRGRRLPTASPLPRGDYFALLSRAQRRPICDVYPRTIRQPLPSVPVPLLLPDADIVVDLQALFATAFDRGRYAKSLPYDRPPAAPVDETDRSWAEACAASIRRA